jgi:hypothetical protein
MEENIFNVFPSTDLKVIRPNLNFIEIPFFYTVKTLEIINQPKVSGAIAGSYGGLAIFIFVLAVAFAFTGLFTPMETAGLVAAVVLAFVEAVMLLILRSLYSTRYVLSDQNLSIRTSRLIGGSKKIPLNKVESVEKTLIPFGIRLFGASFHGGYYKIPNLGRAFVAITNFNDGLLIKTKEQNYIITPKNPEKFKEAIERKTRES